MEKTSQLFNDINDKYWKNKHFIRKKNQIIYFYSFIYYSGHKTVHNVKSLRIVLPK